MATREFSLGTKQQVSFTLERDDFGKTEGDREACVKGLAEIPVGVDGKETILSRQDLADHVQVGALATLKDAREIGQELMDKEAQKADAEREAEALNTLAEIHGVDVEQVKKALAFVAGGTEEAVEATEPDESMNDVVQEQEPYRVTTERSSDDGGDFFIVSASGQTLPGVWYLRNLQTLRDIHAAGAEGRPFELVEVENDGY